MAHLVRRLLDLQAEPVGIPNLIAARNDNKTGVTALTTPAFTPNAGDLIVIKSAITSAGSVSTPAASGWTFTSRVAGTDGPKVQIWTAVAPATASATITAAHTSNQCAWTVEQWRNATLDATPVTVDSAVATTTPNVAFTTEAPNSCVSWMATDNNEDAATTQPMYRPGDDGLGLTTEELRIHFAGAWTVWSAYQRTGAADATALGWGIALSGTSISGRLAGIEVLALNAAPPRLVSQYMGFI